MKKIILYGNCQITNISSILRFLYQEELEVFNLKQVQKINNSNYFNQVLSHLKDADFIVTQNVNDPDKDPFTKILPFIKREAKVIFIDSLYNNVYNPELVKLNNIPSFKIGMLHDINILKAFMGNVSLKNFLSSDPFYNVEFYNIDLFYKNFNASINALKSRQKNLKKINNYNFEHISIIPYILNMYMKSNIALWSDFNHPKLPVYEYLLKEIVKKLGLNFNDDLFSSKYNIYTFQNINRPTYASTIKYFNLKNDHSDNLYSLGRTYLNKTREEYVSDVYNHYNSIFKKY